MTAIFTTQLNGKKIEIFEEEEIVCATAQGGAAPWNIGVKSIVKIYYWHVDGKYHSTYNWSSKKNMQDFYLNQFKRYI